MSIIKSSKALSSAIDKTFASMRKVNSELMSHAVSVVWHMGEHRDPSLLNKLFAGLPPAMQAGFKRWIVAKSIEAVSHLVIDAKVGDLPFTLKKDKFEVKSKELMPNSVELTSAIAAFMLANEETEGFGDFMGIDPDKSPPPFDVIYISKQLHALLNKADKKGEVPETVKLALAESVKSFDSKVKAEIEDVEIRHRLAENAERARIVAQAAQAAQAAKVGMETVAIH